MYRDQEQKRHSSKSVHNKIVSTETNWTFKLRNEKGVDVPVYVVVGFGAKWSLSMTNTIYWFILSTKCHKCSMYP